MSSKQILFFYFYIIRFTSNLCKENVIFRYVTEPIVFPCPPIFCTDQTGIKFTHCFVIL